MYRDNPPTTTTACNHSLKPHLKPTQTTHTAMVHNGAHDEECISILLSHQQTWQHQRKKGSTISTQRDNSDFQTFRSDRILIDYTPSLFEGFYNNYILVLNTPSLFEGFYNNYILVLR